MGSVNKAILVGNLGRDAEMRFTAGGTPVATVSLATTERFTDREGQKKEDTQWHRIVIWGKTAESLHEYLTKGKQIYVEGKIRPGSGRTRKASRPDHGNPRGSNRPARWRRRWRRGTRRRQAISQRYEGGEQAPDSAPVDAPHDDDIPF
jgi:single-strand DNA-binding protein